jgi:hypothetical protein
MHFLMAQRCFAALASLSFADLTPLIILAKDTKDGVGLSKLFLSDGEVGVYKRSRAPSGRGFTLESVLERRFSLN